MASASIESLVADLERLRRRVREFSMSLPDDGPEFLRSGPARHATFEHTLRCTACGVHNKARNSADGPTLGGSYDGGVADFGLRRQLFWDDWAILTSCNVRRQQATPFSRQTVLRADRPWEGYTFGFYGTVLYEPKAAESSRYKMRCRPDHRLNRDLNSRYKMWYRPFESGMAVATSPGQAYVGSGLGLQLE